MSRDRTPFGERMYESRMKAGLTQVQVREKLGISQGTLSEAERTANSSSRVADFAELYGVDPVWLATGRDSEPLAESKLERLFYGAITAAGVDVESIRTLRTRSEYVQALHDFGHDAPALDDVKYVPDMVIQGRDDTLVFLEVKGPFILRHGEMEKLLARGEMLPGKLVVVGAGQPIDRSVELVLKELRLAASATKAREAVHNPSSANNTGSLARVQWAALKTADLTQPFELEVVDEALAPEIFMGCIALMDPDRPPEPGWPVLVRDRDNHHYLRDYKVGVGSRWSAVPRAAQRDMFDALDSEAHGLEIIAAMDGYKRPRPRSR